MDRHSEAVVHAAAQHFRGTIRAFPVAEPEPSRRVLRPVALPIGRNEPFQSAQTRMSNPPKPREFFIQGVTKAGKTFRPSDWSERLAGALSSFRPKGSGIGAHIGYSPYCVPRVIDGIKCVIVNEALRDIEPMAWDFAMHFARDNELQVVEACLLPDPPSEST
jgi:hypothetical protein